MKRLQALWRGALLTAGAAAVCAGEGLLLLETLRRGLAGLGSASARAAAPRFLAQTCNTLLLTGAALFVSIPLAAGAAAWLLRTRRRRMRRALLRCLSALSGVPSAVYGLFGYLAFGSAIGLGYSLLTGALTAALLTLPPAVFLIRGALLQADGSVFRSALALGASQERAVFGVQFAAARPGIESAAYLAASRIAAESAALLLTSGIGDAPPRGIVSQLFRSGATLTVGLYQSVLEGETALAFSAGVLLMLFVSLLQALAAGR